MMAGDPDLAALYDGIDVPEPRERILETDYLLTAYNRDKLGDDLMKRIVKLECGHFTITRNVKKAGCKRCHRMIVEGYDYDAFRNLQTTRDPIEDDEPLF
jgi:hypothetical protein